MARALEGLGGASLINEAPSYRGQSGATVLHRARSARQIPLRAILADCLAQLQQMLARLEAGLYLPKDAPGAEYETTIRQLYLRTQDQVRVLEAELELELE